MPEAVQNRPPEQDIALPESQGANPHQALSQAALEGVGIAAQHYYGADGHFMGRSNDGEQRLIVTTANEEGREARQDIGNGETTAEALHDSLTKMRTLETVRTKPITHLEMTDSASVYFTSLEHYNPRVAPGTETYPVPSYLEAFVTDAKRDNNTYENTIKNEGWQADVRAVLESYLATDPDGKNLQETLKISSLDHLTPEQAVKLSAAFVQNVSKYSDEYAASKKYTRADHATATELLKEGIGHKGDSAWTGNVVCRNIAGNVKAVFESLKATQGELSMLNNTYAVFDGGVNGAGYSDKRDDGIMVTNATGHAWNKFITIDAKGSAIVTIIDATWALDHDAESAAEHLDRTDMRAASQMVLLFGESSNKAQAFVGLSYYLEQIARRTQTNPNLTSTQKDNIREYATTEYLKAAAELPETSKDHNLPSTFVGAAFRMAERLDKSEVITLFNLDKADKFEQDRIKSIIKSYANAQVGEVAGDSSANKLIFGDNDLQELTYQAIGPEKVAHLAEMSSPFRIRLRKLHPEVLKPFDPHTSKADAKELTYIAAESGIQTNRPEIIFHNMRTMIREAVGDPNIFDAIVAGRSDYDFALNFKAIYDIVKKGKK